MIENRLTAYAEQYPDQYKKTEDDVVIGCKSLEIAKRRISFWLTAPYSEERRRAASKLAKENLICNYANSFRSFRKSD